MAQKTETQQDQVKFSTANASGEVATLGRSSGHEQLAKRAYEIFLERDGQPGAPEDDWFRAERELGLGKQPRVT